MSRLSGMNYGAAALERAIRPFLTDPPQPRRERKDPPQDTSEAAITWRCSTNVEVTSVAGISFRVVNSEDNIEVYRETEVVRVTNPSDSNQFVDVENTKRVDFKDGQKRKAFKFK